VPNLSHFRKLVVWSAFGIAITSVTPLCAAALAAEQSGHADPVAPILLALVLITIGAAVAGRLMRQFGQAAVLGELLAGVAAANLGYYFHEPVLTVLREGETIRKILDTALTQNVSLAAAAQQLLPSGGATDRLVAVLAGPGGVAAVSIYSFVDLLSRIGVIVLLFAVGLETSLREMRKVGRNAFFVAVVGVVAPFLFGVGVLWLLMPDTPLARDLFIGGILTATSVGITARVFRDLKQTHRIESRVILGAAVIDDVLGLLVLAVVSALVVTGTISWIGIAGIGAKAIVFLAGSIGIGLWLTPRLAKAAARLHIENFKLLFGLGVAFALSWVSNWIGLATIIGAFAAGLICEEFFFKELQQEHTLSDLLAPVETLIVPVFFVLMGMQVKLETLADWNVLALAAALTAVAIAGKVMAGWACSKPVDRLSVGLGMMPRGEVGLVFAGIGKGLGVVTDSVFSAVVVMVMLTTLLAPPLLKWSLQRSAGKAA
jgi:Kef-type K+ transport system membrane component KefB